MALVSLAKPSVEYGLTADTVTEFQLVLPDGTVRVVREQDKDLWFALRGALLSFVGDQVDPAQAAFAKFLAQQHDRRAAQLGIQQRFEPPSGLYDELLNLSTTTKSIFKGAFTGFVSSQFLPTYKRVYFDGIPMLRYTVPIMKAFTNETKFWGDRLTQYDQSVLVVFSLDPFESDILTHGGLSAYPPDRSLAVLPSSIYLGWTDQSVDAYMAEAMRHSAASLMNAGIQDGQDLKNAAPYVNYALFGTPLETMFGEHLERLREIRKKYDPEDVMGLAGGWKF
ncbi:hypothetical protein BC826DRAFT_1105166 [Russula brevipes]|nr:hypothetical protein BC826DRAFT_1105166 [Russula brevipes]